jgi:hypothetical protein
VEAVSAFVQQRLHVVVAADAVDEDEGEAHVLDRIHVAARRLAWPRHQIEKFVTDEQVEVAGEDRIDGFEEFAGDVDVALGVAEGLDRLAAGDVHAHVPRA